MLYIHIPFCKTRCIYCSFFSSTNKNLKQKYIDALCLEINQRRDYLPDNQLDTIYFGGGTPSLLLISELEKIFEAINQNFIIKKDAEITIEANPDDLCLEYISLLAKLPFNRISIGIQSFNDKELRFLRRRHTAEQAKKTIENCQKYGFKNISIDLIHSLPNQTLKSWQNSVNDAINLNIQHISAYTLTYEEDTKLTEIDKIRHFSKISDKKSEFFFEILNENLKNADFEHYEISNYCKKKFFSRHNSGYWNGANYLGVGAAAHSFNGNSRSWNVANLEKYCTTLSKNRTQITQKTRINTKNNSCTNLYDLCPVSTTEILTENDKYNELIFLSLRTKKGLDLEKLKTSFGNEKYSFLLKNAKNYIDKNILIIEGNFIKINEKSFIVSNQIMSDLMFV